MKRIFFAAIFIIALNTYAQPMESVRWISKFGVAIGVNPVYAVPDVGPINEKMTDFGIGKFSDSGFFGLGGSGYVYILLVDNLRVGGMGFSVGSTKSGTVFADNSPNVNQIDYKREAEYSLGIGGLTVEYTLPFIKPVAVSVGGILGAGSMNLNLYQNAGEYSWEGVWEEFESGENTEALNMKIKDSFYTFTPTINIDYPITRFFAARIGAGYIFTFDNDWTLNNDQKLNNVPSDLKADSFFIQAGVYLGFFVF